MSIEIKGLGFGHRVTAGWTRKLEGYQRFETVVSICAGGDPGQIHIHPALANGRERCSAIDKPFISFHFQPSDLIIHGSTR